MSKTEEFVKHIQKGYSPKGAHLILGGAMLDEEPVGGDAHVKIPLKTMNRHGLIAGATGTGKTKSLQVISEQLSEHGVPVLVMDIKGDLSGLAAKGKKKGFITERHTKINLPYSTKKFPVELLTLSEQDGVRLRATVSEFGPILLSRILELNPTQSGIMSMIFKFCDDNQYGLLDLKDLKKVLRYITEAGKEEFTEEYGKFSTSSTGVIMRKIIELEQQGGDLFFGELSLNIMDLIRTDKNGNGYINIIRLNDIQDKPKLFSTFILCLLAEIYDQMPEKGDAEKPELVIFIDEAHLIFKKASPALLEQIDTIIKLIRSKGIGIYFVTQVPSDVPENVLSQLGLKVQHALRAYTAKDRKAIKLTAENYPLSDYYETDEVITALGIGEALVTGLDEKGRPTPLAATMMRAPMSRMDILSQDELDEINDASKLVKKYAKTIDPKSAYEILSKKIEKHEKEQEEEKKAKTSTSSKSKRKSKSSVGIVLTSATFIRGAMGILKKLIS